MIGLETAITGLSYQLFENLKIILKTMYVEKGWKTIQLRFNIIWFTVHVPWGILFYFPTFLIFPNFL